MDAQLVSSLLETNCQFGASILPLKVTESTMVVAKALVENNCALHGHVIQADFQTQGQGNVEGRKWESSEGSNICVTVLVKDTTVDLSLQSGMCLAICESLRDLGINASLKWPNDTVVAGLKISGVMVRHLSGFYSVGFGVNINEDMAVHDDRCSVLDILNTRYPREILLASILNKLSKLLFETDKEDLMRSYQAASCTGPGARITVFPNRKEDEDNFYLATVKGFNSFGQLQVQPDNSTDVKTLATAEVSIRVNELADRFKDVRISSKSIKDELEGFWRNEMGSFLFLSPQDGNVLEGWYATAVGNVPSEQRCPIRGSWSVTWDQGAILGWTVAWEQPNAPKSLTTFSGRFYPDKEYLDTEWLLVSEKPSKESWKSFLTNKNRFTKTMA